MRKAIVVGFVILGVWWWRRGGGETWEPMRVQIGVLPDGFAALVRPRDVHDSRRVVELDRDAAKQHEMALRHDVADVRLVGMRAGIGIGWQDGRKLKLGVFDDDGNPEQVSTWGKNVVQMCDGAASNEYRFGVGWLESDQRVWFVHGPVAQLAGDTALATEVTDEAMKVSWCGVASAERNVALLVRDGDRLYMNFCTAKKCSSLTPKVPLAKRDKLLGYGCVADACLFATRDPNKNVKLYRVDERGRAIIKPLENATDDTAIAVVGAGTRAFAIGYVAKDGLATVQRVTVDGAISNVRTFEDREAPSLAWAADKLYVVLQSERMYAVDLPR
jgi:hypothetical protein